MASSAAAAAARVRPDREAVPAVGLHVRDQRGGAGEGFVGVRAAGRSTATRRLNAGDVTGACKAITWWNKAGGRVIRGLVNRRTEDQTMCLSKAKQAP